MVCLRIRSRAAGNDEKLLRLPNDRALTAIAEILNRVFQETNKQSSPLSAPSAPSCKAVGQLCALPRDAGACEGALMFSFCSCALPFTPVCRRWGRKTPSIRGVRLEKGAPGNSGAASHHHHGECSVAFWEKIFKEKFAHFLFCFHL